MYAANPNEPENYFTVSEQSRGYNLLHLNALYDLGSRRYVDALVQPRRQADEVGAFVSMIDRFPFDERVIFTADRGYESYNVLAHIEQRGMRYLIRVKQPMSSGIIRGLKLPQNTAFDLDFHIVLQGLFLLPSSPSLRTTTSTNCCVRARWRPILVTLDRQATTVFVAERES